MTIRNSGSIVMITTGLTLTSLVFYTVVSGFGHDLELMLTVIIVRAAAGLGLGLGVAIVWLLASLVTRREIRFGMFCMISAIATSFFVMGTVLLNLLQSR